LYAVLFSLCLFFLQPQSLYSQIHSMLRRIAWMTVGAAALLLSRIATAQSACAQLGVNCHMNSSGGYHPYYYNPARAAYYRQMHAQQALQRRHTRAMH
jgi:hypothetical protein